MAARTTSTFARVPQYDGFRVASRDGVVGVVEEAWLGTAGEVAAFAVRLPNGLRGLLLADDVQAVLEPDRELLVSPGTPLLELAVPRLEGGTADGHVAAHWETTGEQLPAVPSRPPLLRRLRPRLGAVEREFVVPTRPLWQTVALLYGALALLVVTVIALAFLVAFVVTGRPY
jgi:hypothetical protein